MISLCRAHLGHAQLTSCTSPSFGLQRDTELVAIQKQREHELAELKAQTAKELKAHSDQEAAEKKAKEQMDHAVMLYREASDALQFQYNKVKKFDAEIEELATKLESLLAKDDVVM